MVKKKQWLKQRSILICILMLFGLVNHALAASCAEPNLTDNVVTDTTYSGDVYIDQRISIHQGATLTLEAGTQVTMCNADAAIFVGKLYDGGGGLVAIGTEQNPIVFNALDPAVKWDTLSFNWKILSNSTLQHVVLNDGGNDPDLDPDPTRNNAALFIGYYIDNAAAVPVIDHVTINNSGSNGLVVEQNAENDPTAASISNITISGSAAAAVVGDAGAIGGLSGNNLFTGNNPDRIIVDQESIRAHSTWRDHGVPYELTQGVSVRTTTLTTEPVTWTLEPGVTLLVHPGENLVVGSNSDATLNAVGTESDPIIITRLGEGEDFWGQFKLDSDTNHVLEHVEITWGGKHSNPADTYGMIRKTLNGAVNMANVRIEHSASSAMEIRDGDVYIRDSVIVNNPRVGMYLCCGAGASIRNSQIYNNLTGGILNYWPNENCVDAVGNYWGDAGGPTDNDDRASACGDGGTNAGLGDTVTAGVIYRPWLASAGGTVTNRSQVSVAPPFVIADGKENAEITVTLRDLSGAPLAGRNVELQSTVGNIIQPGQASDANGLVTAFISSATPGFATVTATNLTDNDQVAGVGGVSFWQGPGDTGGLIDPNGTPYAKPELIVDRPPFIVGFPMEFSLPMQNTQPNPLDVEVVYGVTNLNIGVRFTPVFTTQKTLAPGEQWSAPAAYVPDTTGHQCVQAALTFDDGSISTSNLGGALFQKNTTKNPCDDLDVKNLVPRGGGLGGVLKHVFRSTKEATKVNKCLNQQLQFGSNVNAIPLADPAGIFDQVFVPPVLTPPQVTAVGEITSDLAEVEQRLAQEIAEYEASDFASITFTDAMRRVRDKAVAQGNDLVSRYGNTITSLASAADVHALEPMSWEFVVGHQQDDTNTVELLVKPLKLPVDWSYELSERVMELGSGETRKVTLGVNPGPGSLGGETVKIAVEGYVSDELIGGIEFEYFVPRLFTSMNCTPGDNTINGPVTYLGGDLAREEAEGKISTSGEVVLEGGTTLTYMAADSIRLAAGFRAQPGSTFTAKTGPVTCVTGP